MTNRNYLPGCYANLPLTAGESLLGYLLRLAEANGYAGIRDLLRALRGPSSRGIAAEVRELRASKELLGQLGRMAVGDEEHCSHFHTLEAGPHAVIFQGTVMDHDSWLEPSAQLCPHCLDESGIARDEWDLSCVTACEKHRVQLLDTCTACGHPISWMRSGLTHCPSCGADYRSQEAPQVDEDVLTVSGDFAAMAGFRYRAHAKSVAVGNWHMGFELFRLMSLDRSHWASDEYPHNIVRQLPVVRRLAVTCVLAEARVNHVYELTRLAPRVADMLSPLRIFPKPLLVERYALKYVKTHASLAPEMAEAVVSGVPLMPPVEGHELFAGRPPSLVGVQAAMSFLGVDSLTYAGLLQWGALSTTQPSREPFDIDDLLAAQRFLNEELLTLEEQQAVFGVPLALSRGPQEVVLECWNRKNPSDMRISVEVVRDLHLRVMARWTPGSLLAEPVTLLDIAMKSGQPIAAVVRAVSLIASGAISRFDWLVPYRWADVLVEAKDSQFILQQELKNSP